MLSKTLALTSVAALAGQSLAFNAHRALHAEKRAVKYVYETVWSTVYVTADCDEAALATTPAKLSPSVALVSSSAATTVETTSTFTSTSTVTVASSSSQAASQPPSKALSPSKETSQAPPSSALDAATPVPPTSSASATTPPPPPPPKSSTSVAPVPPSSASSASSASHSQSAPKESALAVPGGGKLGLAYNDASLVGTFAQHCASSPVAYNWGSDSSGLDKSIPFVPLLWGNRPEFTSVWQSNANAALANGAPAMLSFNEPDNDSQSNLDPQTAAQLHGQYMGPFYGKVPIGSPAVTNSGTPGQGIDWLTQFMKFCDALPGGCPVNFCVLHWYSQPEYEETLYDHIAKGHEACGGRPIWLTEFAPIGDPSKTKSFLESALPKLDQIPYLEKYFYFMLNTNSLMVDATTLSDFGETYASH